MHLIPLPQEIVPDYGEKGAKTTTLRLKGNEVHSPIKVFQGNPDKIKPVLALRRQGYFLRENQPNIFPARSSENPSLRFSPE